MNVLLNGFSTAVVIHVERVETKRTTLLTEFSNLIQTYFVYVLARPLDVMSNTVTMISVGDYPGTSEQGVDSLLSTLLKLIPVLSITSMTI